MVAYQRLVFRLAIRREAHEFVFARVDLKTRVIRECAIEHPKRVRKADLTHQVDLIAATNAPGRRAPFADTIEGHDRSFLKRRSKERARSVRPVLRREVDRPFVFTTETAVDLSRKKELLI